MNPDGAVFFAAISWIVGALLGMAGAPDGVLILCFLGGPLLCLRSTIIYLNNEDKKRGEG